jgi:glycosyltransferase involved in cell wall biosynthesis
MRCEQWVATAEKAAAGKHRTSLYVHLAYGKDIDAYRQDYLAGNQPDESPYGFHHAVDEGFEVSFSRDRLSHVGDFIRRAVRKILQFDLLHAFANRHLIRRADVIWVMTEQEAFAVAFLIFIGIVPKRTMIANAVWLLNEWPRKSRLRKWLYRRLSMYMDVLTVHSQDSLHAARRVFPDLRTELMYFGINTGLFEITQPSVVRQEGPIRIFAPGNDRTRDWDTLLEAFGGDDRFELTLICWWLPDEKLARFSNVTVVPAPSMGDFLTCYDAADVVAIPMRPNLFSGITVALEATAMGKPLLSTRTGGVPTYFDPTEALYVPPLDARAMREALLSTTFDDRWRIAQRAQRRFLERDYSARAVVKRYTALTREARGVASG